MSETTVENVTTEHIAAVCKALGDPMRVEIVRILAANSYGVLELAEIFQVTQPRMSHHLKVLANSRLVSTRREGSAIFYRRPQLTADDHLAEFKRDAYISIDTCDVSTQTIAGLERIHKARAEVSQRFFVDNTEKFRAQQDLIASYPIYAQAITELLDASPIPNNARALELGPGEGEFLAVLSPLFDSVTALDNSPSMLKKAQTLSQQNNLDNIIFIEGDTSTLAKQADPFDTVVANMVLHHTPSPLSIFKDLYPALHPNGVLLITDLCLHDQAWAKEACGDLWLGFDPSDIDNWAAEAGFRSGQSQYLALRNGFQIQIKQFLKS